MATTPSWQAARAGMPGDLDGTNASAQVNQLLGTHAVTPVYQGNQLVTPVGTTNFEFVYPGVWYDYDQPFTLPSGQTAIGRITLPVKPMGNGADLVVTLLPDNGSGAPNTANVLASTTIPAAWINQLTAPDGLAAGGPLATAQTNSMAIDNPQTFSWGNPAISGNGAGLYANVVSSGNYMILIGGFDNTASASSPTVVSVPYLGGTQLGGLTAQPPLPEGMYQGMAAATSNALMYAGGYPGTSSSITTDVWVAPWDPNVGSVGAWSKQTALPNTLQLAGCASWGNNVYIVAGGTTAGQTITRTNAVIYTTITNGTAGAWQTAAPYPQAVITPVAAAINGWLIACGGDDANNNIHSEMYYAKINADGSLGAWTQGPSMPVGIRTNDTGWSYAVTDSALILAGGKTDSSGTTTSATQILTVTEDGPGTWQQQTYPQSINEQVCAFPAGTGTWQLFTIGTNAYTTTTVYPMPVISVPLVASGLTGGATYHVMLQQAGGDSAGSNRGNDYLGIGIMNSGLPSSMLYRNRGTTTWGTFASGWAIPIGVYDQGQTGRLLHTWEDPSSGAAARTSTLVNDHRGRLLGVCEQTALPNNPLNSNPNFTTGVSPWTAVGGTITQSNAQTHGGNTYSGLLTPNGTSSSPYARSELLPVTPGQYYTASGWVYSPNGYSSVSLSVIWYDRAGNSLSSSNSAVSVTAATWTQLTNVFQAPAGAAQAALAPAEGGTPPASATLYLSNITLTSQLPKALASVAQVDYGQGVWPPTGVTQLA